MQQDVIRNLEDHEQSRDVQTRNGGELYRGQIERRAIKRQQRRPKQIKANAHVRPGRRNRDPDDRVADRFKDRGHQDEQEDPHIFMFASGSGLFE